MLEPGRVIPHQKHAFVGNAGGCALPGSRLQAAIVGAIRYGKDTDERGAFVTSRLSSFAVTMHDVPFAALEFDA
jgi:hypothetical protein